MDKKLRDLLINSLEDHIARDIEIKILCELAKESKWYRVQVKNYSGDSLRVIRVWVAENIRGPYCGLGDKWMFRDCVDASTFKLKWNS